MAYLRDKKKCPGCRTDDESKAKSCNRCIIKNCDQLKKNNWKFCSDNCKKYPCRRLKNLDKRYRTKYDMSMIDNLESINKNGIDNFINNEEDKWIDGDKIFCVHHKKYYELK